MGWFENVKEWAEEAIDGLFERGELWLKGDIIAPFITDCRELGDSVFTDLVNNALDVLKKTPGEWNPSGWSFIVGTVNNVFVLFASQLVVLFFLIGFFAESVDPKHDIRIETIMKALFKILFAQFLVVNSVNIITSCFSFVAELTPFSGDQNYTTPAWQLLLGRNVITETSTAEIMAGGIKITNINSILMETGLDKLILTMLVAIIYLGVMVLSGGMIAYTAYMRFFKIMLIVPYGALASSTVAGNGTLNHTAVQFYKYVLSVIFEAVTMIVAMGLYTHIASSGTFSLLTTNELGWMVLYALLNRGFLALLLVGAVKGAGQLTQRVLGL